MKKTTKCMRQNIRQNKRKQNHQVEFSITQKNWSGENGDQFSLFFDGLRKVNFTRDYLSNKLFKLKPIKLMTNVQKTYQLTVIITN